MGLLDKAKEKASAIAEQAKDKFEDVKGKRKADDLLDDLGRIAYRHKTDRREDGDAERIDALVAQLKELEDDGVAVLGAKPAPHDDGADD